MKSYTALVRLLPRGKLTVPKEVRDVLGLRDGEIIEITVSKIPQEEVAQNSNEDPREALAAA